MERNLKKRAACLGLAAALSLAAAGIAFAAEEDTFVQGTSVNGLGISRMTVQEAAEHISSFYTKQYALTIKERGGAKEVISGAEIGFAVGLPEGFLQEMLQAQNTAGRVSGPDVDNRHRTELHNTYNQEALNERITGLDFMTGNGIVPTSDAHVSAYQAGQPFVIVPEVRGNNVDKEKTAAAILNAVETGAAELDLEAAGCYFEPKTVADSAEIQSLCDTMNRCRNMSVTYHIGEETTLLDSATLCSWLMGSADGQILVNREQAAAYVKELAEQYDTAGTERVFRTVTGAEVPLNGPYGWKINQTAEVDALAALIQTGESAEREPVYAAKAAERSEREWGSTYVEIDLTGQHVYMTKDGAVVWDAPCVTGNLAKQYDTPSGIYGLTYKERDRVLRGEKRADGTYEYETPVSYWLPFNRGIGLHDANWRSKFGGEIYKTNGSHGCINLPPEKVGALYEMMVPGMPVICY